MLNNNTINVILNKLYSEITGKEVSTPISTKDFIDSGEYANELIGSREQFTKSLLNQIMKNIFTDSKYNGGTDDEFYVDSEQFGAITQVISVEAPEVQESHAWQNFVSGTSTVGEYTVYLPIVDVQIYGKTISWELPITITNEQWDTAFKSESELNTFINYVFLSVENAIQIHLESINMANRNNFIAEKIKAQNDSSVSGIHVINLVDKYNKEVDSTITSAKDFMNNADCLRWASNVLGLYIDYIKKPTSLFNTKGKVKFVPNERVTMQILSAFKSKFDSVALSTTFHDKFIELPNHRAVPYWQTPNASSGEELSFNSVSSINIALDDETTIEKSGIVAILLDKWAIMHTIIKHRVASKYFDPEALTTYFYQYRDKYINNLGLNAVVFTVEDAG